MKQTHHLISIFGLILFLSLPCSGNTEEIMIFGNDAKPPKYYIQNQEAKGILVDIMRYMDRKMPQSFTFRLVPWKRAYENALKARGGIIGLSKTEERLQLFDYSEAMFVDTVILVVLQGNEFAFNSIEDLKGKRIGVQRGSSYGDKFEQVKKLTTLDLDNNGEQRLLKLLANRIDVALIGPGKAGLYSVLEQNEELLKHKDKFVVLEKPFTADPNYLGFAKSLNKSEFLTEFNTLLEEAIQSGEIQNIITQYYSQSNTSN